MNEKLYEKFFTKLNYLFLPQFSELIREGETGRDYFIILKGTVFILLKKNEEDFS